MRRVHGVAEHETTVVVLEDAAGEPGETRLGETRLGETRLEETRPGDLFRVDALGVEAG